MTLNMISKEDFVKAIDAVRDNWDCEDEMNKVLVDHGNDGYVFLGGRCMDAVINLLHAIFGKADKDEWISYFCFDLDFGRDYHKGTIRDDDGSDIDLFTAEDLYDFLITNLNEE